MSNFFCNLCSCSSIEFAIIRSQFIIISWWSTGKSVTSSSLLSNQVKNSSKNFDFLGEFYKAAAAPSWDPRAVRPWSMDIKDLQFEVNGNEWHETKEYQDLPSWYIQMISKHHCMTKIVQDFLIRWRCISAWIGQHYKPSKVKSGTRRLILSMLLTNTSVRPGYLKECKYKYLSLSLAKHSILIRGFL
jgi:hypothetical protein